MKNNWTSFLIMALLLASVGVQAQYEIKDKQMSILGSSNLHDWESKVHTIKASGDIQVEAGVLKGIKSLSVEIPVTSIKSPKGSIMDKKTYDALKSDKHPNISFKLTKVNSLNKTGDGYAINATGNLTVAGVTKSTEITVTGKVAGDGSVKFEGSKKMKMTDFGIQPPTALMGTMKTGDDITIKFAVTLGKSSGS
jgi:polyisoprenoid-binding protein YceI